MSDVGLAALWLGVLGGGLGLAVTLHRMGVRATVVRDVLHLGAGVWVFGWPFWNGVTAPIALTLGALVALALVPAVARRSRRVRRLMVSVTGDDERWGGLVLYATASATLTAIGLLSRQPAPAAAGLLALALGDGLGGAIGSRFGRHTFRVPAAKRKSLEGSLTVALAGTLGIVIAAGYFGQTWSPSVVAVAGAVAAAVEALSPRGTDNVAVPLAVWAVLA